MTANGSDQKPYEVFTQFRRSRSQGSVGKLDSSLCRSFRRRRPSCRMGSNRTGLSESKICHLDMPPRRTINPSISEGDSSGRVFRPLSGQHPEAHAFMPGLIRRQTQLVNRVHLGNQFVTPLQKRRAVDDALVDF